MQFPHKIKTKYRWNSIYLNEIRTWLTINIGPPYENWITCFSDGILTVSLLHEKDAILFSLKWS